MTVVLYARVSTRDKDHNPENQLILLRRETERAGDTITKEYVDEESGGKASRKQFKQLMKDPGKCQFDLVRVFALDRFSRQGIEAVFEYTAALDQCRVAVSNCLVKVAEGGIRTCIGYSNSCTFISSKPRHWMPHYNCRSHLSRIKNALAADVVDDCLVTAGPFIKHSGKMVL